MKIVADRGMDMSPELINEFDIHFAPLRITLEEKTYVSGIDLQPAEFYKMLSETESFPTTSQPSAGEFAELYRNLAKEDPDILSIHISSGLSGTINAAEAGAAMVPEANITIVDSKTLSCPFGWQVEVAARALQAGWPLNQIVEALGAVGRYTEGIFTLTDLKYLIHGGRISHLKGLLASLLNIKPIIGVDHDSGKYITFAQEITLKRSINKLVDVIQHIFPQDNEMRIQLLHGMNPDSVEYLHQRLEEAFTCNWLPTVPVAPVLGAHTGPSLVGLSVAPMRVYRDLGLPL